MTQPIKQVLLAQHKATLCSIPTQIPAKTLWSRLDSSTQLQLTQCLAELIQRVQAAEAVVRKEQNNEK